MQGPYSRLSTLVTYSSCHCLQLLFLIELDSFWLLPSQIYWTRSSRDVNHSDYYVPLTAMTFLSHAQSTSHEEVTGRTISELQPARADDRPETTVNAVSPQGFRTETDRGRRWRLAGVLTLCASNECMYIPIDNMHKV